MSWFQNALFKKAKHESNSTVLKAALESNGIAVQKVIAVRDDFDATREALKKL